MKEFLGITIDITYYVYLIIFAVCAFYIGQEAHKEEKLTNKLAIILLVFVSIALLLHLNVIQLEKSLIVGSGLGSFLVGYLCSFLYFKFLTIGYNHKDDIILKTTSNTPIMIKDFKRGVGIFGSSGSAKTQGILYPIMVELEQKKIGGVVYDYKNGELTELVMGIFPKEKIHVFCFDDINSIKINFLDPKIVTSEKDIISVCHTLLNTAFGKEATESKNAYFYNSAKSIFIGVALRFYYDFTEHCSFANIVLFLTSNDFSKTFMIDKKVKVVVYKGLVEFIEGNSWSRIQGANGISALQNETSDVMSTLLSALSKFTSPSILYNLTENSVDLQINKSSDILVLVNTPRDDEFYDSIFSCLFDVITKNLMIREQKGAFLLLDEGYTIKSEKMSKIIATMRSFGIAIFYCCQDVSQGYLQYTRDGFRSIIANMSTMFFGKVNEPETAKFCEGYIDEHKVKEKSHTTGKSGSTTTSMRDKKKIKASEFFKLRQGQFVYTSNGKIKKVKMKRIKINKVKYLPRITDTERQLIEEKYFIMVEAIKDFARGIGVGN
ncbi:MAG: hypothetical protein RL662_2191 [Bacteroidota bacterium]|jgi:type IV secretory pathway TraG/TraD family ATPase VirD4